MTNQANTILSRLLDITTAFEDHTVGFIDSFETKELLSFSDTDEKRKKFLRAYNDFSIKINKYVEKYETNINELSLLMCKADRSHDAALTKKLSVEFDRYSLLFKAIKKFITSCESLNLKKDPNANKSTVIKYAGELLVALDNYKKNF